MTAYVRPLEVVRPPARDSARGWTVVFAAFVGLLISFGTLVIYSYGVMGSAMAADLQWNSFELGTIFASSSLAATIGGPIWGAVADRWGGARAAVASSALLALGLAGLLVVPGSIVAMHIVFALLGLAGAGTMPPTYASVLVGWFDRHRGLALGVAMTGVGVGAAAMPPIAAALTAQMGWRMTYAAFGAVLAVIVLPAAILLLKPYPQPVRAVGSGHAPGYWNIRPFLAERKAWTLAVFAFVTGAVLVTSVSNFVPILQSRGSTLAEAARFQSILGLSLILGRIALGGLIDRVFAPYVMMTVLAATSAGFFVLYAADSPIAYLFAAAGIGLAIGAEVDFLGFMVSRYFERSAFTTIFAILFALYALGGSIGPLAFGWLAQRTGSYDAGILIFAVLVLAVAFSMPTLPAYARRDDADAATRPTS